MAEKQFETIFKLKRANANEWPSAYILKAGEPGFELDTKKLKIGDGTTTWANLPYIDSNTEYQLELGANENVGKIRLNYKVIGANSYTPGTWLDLNTFFGSADDVEALKVHTGNFGQYYDYDNDEYKNYTIKKYIDDSTESIRTSLAEGGIIVNVDTLDQTNIEIILDCGNAFGENIYEPPPVPVPQ